MTHRLALAALVAISLLSACGDSTGPSGEPITGPGDYTRTVRAGGRTRSYVVHVTPGWSTTRAAPLVVLFHGAGGDPAGMRRVTAFDATADARGWLAAYPEAPTKDWNLGCGHCTAAEKAEVDDTAFVRVLIDDLVANAGADPARVYATGLSQGGQMAHTAACALPGRVAAFASVAATLLGQLSEACAPARAVPAMLIHGTADPAFPWLGGVTEEGLVYLGLEVSADFWAARNGCDGAPVLTPLPDTADDGTQARRLDYPGCAPGEVVVYTLVGGGHTWPGADPALFGPDLGPVSREIDANTVMADFFARHAIP
ncbi:MAG TPA: PHB depolymerase family esterase [Longimicrobium sp.]|nr:PHB depolymerase family esterase [Longimicrobium sp.]